MKIKKNIIFALLSFSLGIASYFLNEAEVSAHGDYISSIFIILGSEGTPITTEQNLRFSLWADGRLKSGDISEGVINVSAPYYQSYQTVLTRTPDEAGRVKISFSELPSLPEITPCRQFIMVEYKASGDPDTSYQIYRDLYITNTHMDRFPLIVNGPDVFAGIYNNIATTADNFILDQDDTGGDVELQFGKTLGEKLYWDTSEGRFTLTNSLLVEGGFRVNTNYLVVNGTTGKVGIGTTDPGTTLDVNGGIRPGFFTSDPCGTLPEGTIWYNDTDNYFCFCDENGVDKKMSVQLLEDPNCF